MHAFFHKTASYSIVIALSWAIFTETSLAQEKTAAGRVAARAKLNGKKFPTIKTLTGKTYTGVQVTKVSAAVAKVIHSGGAARIKLEDLDTPLQKVFQYDAEEAAKELAKLEDAEKAKRAAIEEKKKSIREKKATGLKKAAEDKAKNAKKEPKTYALDAPKITKRFNVSRKMPRFHKNTAKVKSLEKEIRSTENQINKLHDQATAAFKRGLPAMGQTLEDQMVKLHETLLKMETQAKAMATQ